MTATIRAMLAHMDQEFSYRDKSNIRLLRHRIKKRRIELDTIRINNYERFQEVVSALNIDHDPAYEFKRTNKKEITVEDEIENEKQVIIDKKLKDFKQKLLAETEEFAANRHKIAQEMLEKLNGMELDSVKDQELINYKQDMIEALKVKSVKLEETASL